MSFELATLIGPAEAVAVSASRAAPETIEILFVSMTQVLVGLCNTWEGLESLLTGFANACLAPLFRHAENR